MPTTYPPGAVHLPITILSTDFVVEIEYNNYQPPTPARGPSLSSPGEPAEGPTFDWEVKTLYEDILGKTILREAPSWLLKTIDFHIDEVLRDRLVELVLEDNQ